jgi:hypothetical protein
VDSSTTPTTFWIASNHGAAILKLEPLDSVQKVASAQKKN